MEPGLDFFVLSHDGFFVPAEKEARPGQEALFRCKYEGLIKGDSTLVTRREADEQITSGKSMYCWWACLNQDCPAYKKGFDVESVFERV